MSTHLSPQEWQALSAYLDNELSERERRQVETRLQARAELRTALEELRQTRSILRSLPKRRAPRNFTLTPAMVESLGINRPRRQGAPWGAYPFLRLASALASFLLVMTFLGDLAIGAAVRNLATSTGAAPMAVESADMVPPSAPQGAPESTGLAQLPPLPEGTPTPEIESFSEAYPFAEAYPFVAGGPEEPSTDETSAPETMMAVPQEPEPDPTIIARMTEAPAGMGGAGEDAPTPYDRGAPAMDPTQDPSMSPKAAPTAAPEMAVPYDAPPAGTAPQAPDARMMFPTPEPTLLPEPQALPSDDLQAQAENQALAQEQAREFADPRNVLRPIEWALGIIAVLTGLAALYLRGKPHA